MVDLIEVYDLATYLGDDAVIDDPRAQQIVGFVNGLITDEWVSPVEPPPTKVTVLALDMAARAVQSVPGRGAVESITRQFDDSSRTERYATSSGAAGFAGVYITADELALLNGGKTRSRVGSIKLAVPGY